MLFTQADTSLLLFKYTKVHLGTLTWHQSNNQELQYNSTYTVIVDRNLAEKTADLQAD